MFENENFIKHPVTVQLYWQYYVTHKVHLYYLHLFYEWEMASKSLWSAELSGTDALPLKTQFCFVYFLVAYYVSKVLKHKMEENARLLV